MKDLLQWMRENLLFDGEGTGEGDAGGGGGGGGEGAGEGGEGAGTGGGAPEPSFRQFIPEEDKDAPYWATIPDDQTLVKNYANAQKLIGKKGIIPPGEGASPEEWSTFFAAVPRPTDDAAPEVKAAYQKFLGAPDSAEAYNEMTIVPEDFPKEFLREDLVQEFRTAAFEAGVPPVYAKAMFDWYMAKSKADLAAVPAIKEIAPGVFVNDSVFIENRDKVAGELKNELGDTYDATLARVQAAVMRFGGKELVQYYEETGLGNHPATIKAWMNVVNSMSEDKNLEKGTPSGSAGIQARLDGISRDPDFLDQWSHPDKHNALIRERDELMAKLHPGVPGIPEK